MKISRRILLAVFCTSLLLMGVCMVQAQDVVKVAPESHKVILENDQVRVLSVHVKPGEKIAMHSHPANVAYFLTDGKVKITYPDGRTEVREPKAGTSSWSEATTHSAENVGSTVFEEVQIEMKPDAKKSTPAK